MSLSGRTIFNYGFHIFLAGVFGVSLAFLLFQGASGVSGELVKPLNPLLVEDHPELNEEMLAGAAAADLPFKVTDQDNRLPPGKVIKADLAAMKIFLYQDGQLVSVLPILSKGRPGSPWETPTGTYRVRTKEIKHFSSIGQVWMPWSLQFFGNFFIHGWPYYENGEPVGLGYSGGCIRLATDDAKQVFLFSDLETVVSVVGAPAVSAAEKSARVFSQSPPKLSARAYLITDVDTGEVILEKNSQEVLPIASITKLVTALVSLEVINQEKSLAVSNRALETFSEAGGLRIGERLPAGSLLYPLLLESSNDAAEVLAEAVGRETFVNYMKERARVIGLTSTSFDDPSGISAGNVSTAQELSELLVHIHKNKRFVLDVLQKKNYSFAGHDWKNFLNFVDDPRYLGGKSGHTTAAGDTLAALFSVPLEEFSNHTIAVILLGSDDREKDARTVLNYLSEAAYYETTDKTSTLSLAFVGDIMLDRGVRGKVAKAEKGWDWLFEGVSTLGKHDVLFGNLEGPVSLRGVDLKNLYSFRMTPEVLPALVRVGFDVLSVANNHIGDWGREALEDTLNNLDSAGLLAVGAGLRTEDVFQPTIIKKNGLTIGFLAASDVGPEWLQPKDGESGVSLAADPRFLEAVKQAAGQTDFLVVSFHFGDEYQIEPNDRQKSLARAAIDAGARLVVGHHPHVRQPIERYGAGVIAYSLGNFIFDQNFSAETKRGSLLQAELSATGLITKLREQAVLIGDDFRPELGEVSVIF